LLLFVLVGAQVNIHVAWKAGLAGALVIMIGLIFRSAGTYLALTGTPFTVREKIFCVVAYIPKATVQAAIGAVPLAAGVASGEIILAVAVLSILMTAPLGAIGIKLLGEKVLESDEKSSYRFKDLRDRLELPRVGERVVSRRFHTVWKIIEEREIWVKDPHGSKKGKDSPEFVPALEVRLWREDSGTGPGTGKTLTHRYSLKDQSFGKHWEVLYDW
jgi:hypothetical protein